jgi:hypothetical protein
MAVSAKAGSFAQPGSTGNQSQSGFGFQPKVVLFWMSGLTADGSLPHTQFSWGAAASSSQRWWVGGDTKDNNTDHSASRRFTAGHCIGILDPVGTGGTILAEADFVSMDSDGFTINWTTVDATARIVNYLALGGSTLTNVFVGNDTTPSSAIPKAYTGVGFQPDAVFLFNPNAVPTLPASELGTPRPALSWATAADARTSGGTLQGGGLVAATVQDGSAIWVTNLGATADVQRATLDSFDADGFTLDHSVAATSHLFYVALKGATFKSGTLTQPTSTGTQTISGLGIQPAALLLASACKAANAAIDTGGQRQAIGAASGPAARWTQWFGANNVNPTEADQILARDAVLMMATPGTPTEDAEADLDSFTADGFILDWVNVDATQREVNYLAIGAVVRPWYYYANQQAVR